MKVNFFNKHGFFRFTALTLLSFLPGALVLSLFSLLQKFIISAPVNIRGFIIPVCFGGICSTIIFLWGYRLRQSKSQLKKSMEQKEILLKELQHRVKNNLQLVSSLFNLSCSYLNEKNQAEMLQRLGERLNYLSYVHELLYADIAVEQIKTDVFLKTLIFNVREDYHHIPVTINFNIEDHECECSKAVSVGLLVYELVTNSLIHAFEGTERGTEDDNEINVIFRSRNRDELELIIADNGKGYSFFDELNKNKTLGIQLIDIFSKQINAVIDFRGSPGSEHTFRFRNLG